MADSLALTRNSHGRLVLTDPQGVAHEGVVPVRAFPISAPTHGISLISRDGHELAWIEHLDELADGPRQLLEAALGAREFMPVIEQLEHVSSFATPSTWTVTTDRGRSKFVLRGEEDIRRLGEGSLLIADSHGIQFLIRDMSALNRHSRKLLDRFL